MESTGESFGFVLKDLLRDRRLSAKALSGLLGAHLSRKVSPDAVEGWLNESDAAPHVMKTPYLDAICAVLTCTVGERARLTLAQQKSRLDQAIRNEGLDRRTCLHILAPSQDAVAPTHIPTAPLMARTGDRTQWLSEGIRLSATFQFRKALEAFAIAKAATSAPDTIALITAHTSAALNALNDEPMAFQESNHALALLNMREFGPSQPHRPKDLLMALRAGDLTEHRLQAYAVLTKVQIDHWHHAGDFNRAQHCCTTLESIVRELADSTLTADLAQLRATTLYELATRPAFGSGRVVHDLELLDASLGFTGQAITVRPATDPRGRGMDHRQRARSYRIRGHKGDADRAELARQEAEINLKHSPARVSLILEQARAAIATGDLEQALSYLELAQLLAWEIESPHLIADTAFSRAALHHPRTGSQPSHETAGVSCALALIAWPFDRRAREFQSARTMFLHELGAHPDDITTIVTKHQSHFAILAQLPSTRARLTSSALAELRDDLARCA